MKIVTINLSEPHVKALEMLMELGLYPSRSEAIRVAIRDFLQRELGFVKKFEELEGIERESRKKEIEKGKREEITKLLKKLKDEQASAGSINDG